MTTPTQGKNVLTQKAPPSDVYFALRQLRSPLIYVLFFASLVTFYVGDYLDTAVIFIAVFVNTILGFIQERKAERGFAELKKMITPTAKVLRNGVPQTIDARDIVVGDIVVVSAGDRIPADGTLVESVHFFVNEAILTGESEPVQKTVVGDSNIFTGTVVSTGRAKFKVTTIGMDTKLGSIAAMLSETQEEETPLQRQLAILARTLAMFVGIICIIIFLVGIARGQSTLVMFTLAVAIAVAAIPEGMIVSLTVIFSVGMQRIFRRHAIVRRLVSAETLGAVSTLCVDKTGTLTEGVMRVVEEKTTSHEQAVKVAVYANNLENPIDLALWEWAQGQNHYDPQEMNENMPRTSEIPFDSVKKYMFVENVQGRWLKGAPEIVLAQCKVSEKEKTEWLHAIDAYAKKGLRVIGLAWKSSRSHLSFIGILGVSDPVRLGAREALATYTQAGISVKIVTGDYRLTSEAVLRQLGLPIKDASTEIMEGSELTDLSIEELVRRISKIILFYRVTPDQKLKIVDALQKLGEVVAMTGDGVNDALALKKADVGIVFTNAADVAKEEADMVLLDFNFATIAAAIEEGRVMFHNIRKVVLYLLSDAFTEMLLITGSIIASVPLPLTAIQILWINILSDGFPDFALAVEPKEHNVMREPPRPKGAPIVDFQIKVMAGSLSIAKAIIAFIVYMFLFSSPTDGAYAQTMAFAIVGTGSLIYVFSTRNLSRFIIKDRITKNPWLLVAVVLGFMLQLLVIYHPGIRPLFNTHPLNGRDWIIVISSGLLLLIVSEITKYVVIKKNRYITHREPFS